MLPASCCWLGGGLPAFPKPTCTTCGGGWKMAGFISTSGLGGGGTFRIGMSIHKFRKSGRPWSEGGRGLEVSGIGTAGLCCSSFTLEVLGFRGVSGVSTTILGFL